MASGHNVTEFAIPALQPLVIYLFVRPTGPSNQELSAQREVVLNMLLRLIEHPHIIQLLVFVLECYQGQASKWKENSALIFAALLAPIGRLQIILDSTTYLSGLHQLLGAMTPTVINIEGFLLALLKQRKITSATHLTRWLAILATALRLVETVFPEETLFGCIKGISLTTPGVECAGIQYNRAEPPETPGDTDALFGQFLLESLTLGVVSLQQLVQHPQIDPPHMLPVVLSDILLLMQILVTG